MQHPEITPTPPVHLPPVHLPPVAKGNAPWERSGASHLPPTSQIAQQKAAKWVQQAEKQRETQEERRKRKEEQRHQRLQQQKQQRIQQLEQNARQMFIAGFFALPLLWLVALIYFRQEHKAQDASPLIKDCKFFFHYYQLFIH